MIEIVDLKSGLPPALVDLVSESERRGHRFLRRLEDEWDSGANRFDDPGEGLFGALAERRLVGVCGLNVDPYADDVSVGRLRHLYVLEAFRGLGVGRALVQHVLQVARGRFRELRLRTDGEGAAAFYERLGFEAISHASATHAFRFQGHGAAA